jgi:hypothetical protein
VCIKIIEPFLFKLYYSFQYVNSQAEIQPVLNFVHVISP